LQSISLRVGAKNVLTIADANVPFVDKAEIGGNACNRGSMPRDIGQQYAADPTGRTT